MKVFFFVFLIVGAGCVSVPIPPTGDNMGKYGNVKISLKFQYLPAEPVNMEWFNPIIPQPKLYKDK